MILEPLLITAPSNEPLLPPGVWPEQGAWTLEDWERLPDDGRRYELIDGALYVTTAPSITHQAASGNLYYLLRVHLAQQMPPLGMIFIAPTGVILPTGPVIPDLVYIHAHNLTILTDKRIEGVPDLVVEIASPSTAGYDRREKQDAYARSGVPEYWWIEPANRTVEALVLETSGRYRPRALVEGKAPIPSLQLPGLSFPTDDIFMPLDLLAAMRRD